MVSDTFSNLKVDQQNAFPQTQPIRDLIVVILLGEFSFLHLRGDVSSQSMWQTLPDLRTPLLLPLCKRGRHSSSRLFVHAELAV